MKENYMEVPNIISGKDLDYLSDMFDWNYIAYKKSVDFSNYVTDAEIKDMLSKTSNTFHGAMAKILNILKNGGNNEQSN